MSLLLIRQPPSKYIIALLEFKSNFYYFPGILRPQKMLEGYNDVFSDIINVLLFNGENVILEDSLTDALSISTLKMDGRIRAQYRDIAKYWHNSKIKLSMFGLENQKKQEKLRPLRVCG